VITIVQFHSENMDSTRLSYFLLATWRHVNNCES